MKKILKWIIPALASCLLLWAFFNTCTYSTMTHLNGDEIAWATNRHEGEVMYLRSQDGTIDTVRISYIDIFNSLDPINWAYFNVGNQDYYGAARVKYYGKHSGQLSVYKSEDGSIGFDSYVDKMWLWDVPLNISSLEVDGKTLNDVMLFDNTNSDDFNEYLGDDQDDKNRIISFAWSKKYGLVQYTLEDGTVFNRIELNDDNLKKTRWFPLNS